MNLTEAAALGEYSSDTRAWIRVLEKRFGQKWAVNPGLSSAEEWGWVMALTPEGEDDATKARMYLVDRETGASIPMGTKGIQTATKKLKCECAS